MRSYGTAAPGRIQEEGWGVLLSHRLTKSSGTRSSGLRLRAFCSLVASVGLGTLPAFAVSVLEHRGVEASKGDAGQRSLRAKAENGTGTRGN